MPTAYDICIKCCVIKLFFLLAFFVCLAHYNVQKRQGGTIKPASAIHLGSVAFLSYWGTSHTPLPGEGRTWCQRRLMVLTSLPCPLPCLLPFSHRTHGGWGSGSRSSASQVLLPSGRAVWLRKRQFLSTLLAAAEVPETWY